VAGLPDVGRGGRCQRATTRRPAAGEPEKTRPGLGPRPCASSARICGGQPAGDVAYGCVQTMLVTLPFPACPGFGP
jgi:hypothetical protein